MLHIILTILKIVFLLLAVIFLLLLAALLLVLFVPVRYEASAEAKNGISASAKITWLLHALTVRMEYRNKSMSLSAKVFGYPLIGRDRQKKKSKSKAAKDTESSRSAADAPETFEAEEIRQDLEPENVAGHETESEAEHNAEHVPGHDTEGGPARDAEARAARDAESMTKRGTEDEAECESGNGTEHEVEVGTECEAGTGTEHDAENEAEHDAENESENTADVWKAAEDDSSAKKKGNPLRGIVNRVCQAIRKFQNSFKSFLEKIKNIKETLARLKSRLDYYKRLWYDNHTQNAYRHVKKELRYLLRHWFARNIRGNVLFGFDDPALTGQVLGALCVLQAFCGGRLQAEADFERVILEGDVYIKGHIRSCHLIKTVISLLADKSFRITFKRIRRKKS
ncbi:MAG: hypothetical protein Q4C50_01825 [Eubacteriales bacterium]|nr:hypothetical protein [Eubacteriales bacterium]